jgi:hypothetical protein
MYALLRLRYRQLNDVPAFHLDGSSADGNIPFTGATELQSKTSHTQNIKAIHPVGQMACINGPSTSRP